MPADMNFLHKNKNRILGVMQKKILEKIGKFSNNICEIKKRTVKNVVPRGITKTVERLIEKLFI